MENLGKPRVIRISLRYPDRPKIIMKPTTAIIMGKIKGAPKKDKRTSLRKKFLLAKARAIGIARKVLTKADRNACHIVNSIIEKSPSL